MQFIIANTFQDSLGRLQTSEQNAAKVAAIELQMNPAHPGLQMHKLDKARDKNFWSARVNDDVRMIVHRTDKSCLLCYVDHHDPAYAWAERRKLTMHPTTGAAQMVVLQETVQEIVVRNYVEQAPVPREANRTKSMLATATDEELLSYGVPEEWVKAVREATEDTVLTIAALLPEEASEAVLNLATGVTPPRAQLGIPPAEAVAPTSDLQIDSAAFQHPDAQRRFRTVGDLEELRMALDAPREKWMVFLHPAQRQLVQRNFKGPAKVAGSAGTGKTIVALHRAVHLARTNPDSRVLLTTFSDTLANALRTRLRLLIGSQPRLGEQIEVLSMRAVGLRLYELNLGKPKLASTAKIRRAVQEASDAVPDHKFAMRFLLSEWEQVVDAWQLTSWEEYRNVTRLGRKTRLSETQRALLWSIFDTVRTHLAAESLITEAALFERLAKHYKGGARSPFDFAVVDEAQDIGITELRFLAAMGGGRANGLFFAGDTGQRIFQQAFSWKALGVDLRGRSTTLKVNYRTSHQIRMQADRLLDGEVSDVDGNTEDRRGTVSLFDGPAPKIVNHQTQQAEQLEISSWIGERIADGYRADDIVLFVRSAAEIPRAASAAAASRLPYRVLDTHAETTVGSICLSTMHLAKGLEFRAVAVMACDEEVIPLQERIEAASDDSDLEDVYNTERQLLYVACTRARDCLLLTSVGSPSEFLHDLQAHGAGRPSGTAS